MDKDNVELIQATVKGLQDKIGSLNMELKNKQQELEDANKPVISSTVMNVVNDAINEAIENYNFDNTDQYELDFSLDYDGRVQAETINLTDTYELMEAIVTKVEKQFNITEDDNSQVNTQTVAEKII
jgi:predicted unusual protein kinase regulating ubiquinone biosynthesis (AarF/ABC1/UbiB family)